MANFEKKLRKTYHQPSSNRKLKNNSKHSRTEKRKSSKKKRKSKMAGDGLVRKKARRRNEPKFANRRKTKQYLTISTASESRKNNSKNFSKGKNCGLNSKKHISLNKSPKFKFKQMNIDLNKYVGNNNRMIKRKYTLAPQKRSFVKHNMLHNSRSWSKKKKKMKADKKGGGKDYSFGDLLTRKSSLNCFKRIAKGKYSDTPLTSLRHFKNKSNRNCSLVRKSFIKKSTYKVPAQSHIDESIRNSKVMANHLIKKSRKPWGDSPCKKVRKGAANGTVSLKIIKAMKEFKQKMIIFAKITQERQQKWEEEKDLLIKQIDSCTKSRILEQSYPSN